MLSKLTADARLIDLAERHSRMVEVAIVRGNQDMAHAAVARAFAEVLALQPVTAQTMIADLLNPRIATTLEAYRVVTVGDLCGLSRAKLARYAGLRYRSIDLIEQALDHHGLHLTNGASSSDK